MLNIVDSYRNEKNRILLTYEQIGIPNLRMIGRATTNSTVLPLETHIHKDCIEIVVVVKGKQNYTVSNRTYKLSGGDVFISFLDEPHGSGTSRQEINELIWFQIDMRYKNGFLGLDDCFGKKLHNKISAIDTHILKTNLSNIKILKSAFNHLYQMVPDNIQLAQSLLITFLNNLLLQSRQSSPQCSHIIQAIDYINNHINDSIEIAELSRVCGLSESRFKHKFTEKMGVTPNYYINSKKVDIAKILLKNNNVTNVAISLGYNSSSYFSVVFKKYTGVTPTDYRNSL